MNWPELAEIYLLIKLKLKKFKDKNLPIEYYLCYVSIVEQIDKDLIKNPYLE